MRKLILIIFLCVVTDLCQATTLTWNYVGGSTAAFTTSTNWTPAQVPTISDSCVVPNGTGNMSINTGSPTCMSLNFNAGTGYTGTVSGTAIINVNKNIILSSGMTITYTGQLSLTGSIVTLNSNGKTWNGITALLSSGAQTAYIVGGNNWKSNGVTAASSTGGETINTTTTEQLECAGGFTLQQATSGTATISVTGGTLRLDATTAGLKNNLITSGSWTLYAGNNYYNTGTWSCSSGTPTTTGSVLIVSLAASKTTFNCPGVTFNNVIFGVATDTINLTGTFYAGGIVTNQGQTTFTGSAGFTVAALKDTTASVTTSIKLTAGNTYTVTGSLVLRGTLAAPRTLLSLTGGSVAYLNVASTVTTFECGFVTATDINSSGGATVEDYKGTLSNTTNWRLYNYFNNKNFSAGQN